jgi:hypothetical protein
MEALAPAACLGASTAHEAGGRIMREQLAAAPASRTDDDADDGDWTIPEDRFSAGTYDPWMLDLDDLFAEEGHPFKYPAGLP